MSDQNKQIAREFLAAFEKADRVAFERIADPDIVDHNAAPGSRPGLQGLLDAAAMFRSGFPDLKISIDRMVAEGDTVAVYGNASGTNTGSLMGAPATGKRAAIAYIDIYRIAGGKIVETWHVEDIAGMLRQLGIIPG